MSTNQISIVEMYTEYVRLRQTGWPMDEVIRQLQPYAESLTSNERQQLGQLVQSWEAREGERYTNTARRRMPVGADMYETLPPASNQTPVSPADTSPKSILRRIDSANEAATPTPQAKYRACPNCGKRNPQGDLYCYSCGHIMEAKPGTKVLQDVAEANNQWGTAHFGQFSALLLAVRGASAPIEITLQDELIIGRRDVTSPVQPDVDLAPYNAEELGVSRVHVVFKRCENAINISDLNSKNFTFINGQRLYSSEIRVLRDGDEIRLGKLPLKVGFKHQLRRL